MRKYTLMLLVAVAVIYLGWIYYSRWSANRAITQRIEEKRAAQDRAIIDAYGGGRFNIAGFYAVPALIRTGGKAQLCYSVVNAATVRIEPPVDNVWPSLSRCVDVKPTSDTSYKLIARDSGGNTKTAVLTVRVLPRP
jgi:hypothetical protein